MYRPLRILTARPTVAEEAVSEHALYGVLAAEESSSVARWLNMVVPVIRTAAAEGKLPLLVGGTGMYLKALMNGLAEVPEIPAEIRRKIRESRVENRESSKIHASPLSLYAMLLAKDPAMAARLKPGDTQRILRALEVIEATGKSLLYFQEQPTQPPLPDARFRLFMATLPRTEIYRRIDARFLKMMNEGALEEVRQLVASGGGQARHSPLFKAHGVPELLAHLRGEMTLEAAIAQAQQNTRNYAKRQMTWLRNQFPQAVGVSAENLRTVIDGSN